MVLKYIDNTKSDKYYVKLILDDIEKFLKYTNKVTYEEFILDEQLIDAISFRLIQSLQ